MCGTAHKTAPGVDEVGDPSFAAPASGCYGETFGDGYRLGKVSTGWPVNGPSVPRFHACLRLTLGTLMLNLSAHIFRALMKALAAVIVMSALVTPSSAADIGQIKVSKGQVSVERNGQPLPGSVGTRLEVADILKTGPDGSVGVTMTDNSLLSAGP